MMDRTPRLRWTFALLIAAYGLTLLCIDLGDSRSLTEHEAYVAQPAREMLTDGRWVVQYFAGVPRYNKPPTMSWLAAGSMAAFDTRAEWAVRLPSVLGAVASALLLGTLAARWFGATAGLVAGLMQLTAVYVWVQARLAEADMLLVAAVTAAMVVFARFNVGAGQPAAGRWRGVVLFACATGAAFLLKGLIGPLFILGGSGAYALWRGAKHREWRPMKFLAHPLAWVVLLAWVVPWPVAAVFAEPGITEAWRREMLGRAAGELGKSRSVFFYGHTVLWLLLPWTPLVLLGGWRGRRWVLKPEGQFLLCWLGAGLVVLQLMVFKTRHYVMPLLGPCVVVGAAALVDQLARQRAIGYRSAGWRALPWGLAGAVGAGVAWWTLEEIARPVAVAAGIGGLGMAAVVLLEAENRQRGQLVALFTTVWLVGAVFFGFVRERRDSGAAEESLGRAAWGIVPPDEPVVMLGLGQESVAYYLPDPIRRADDVGDFILRVLPADDEPVFVVSTWRILDDLPDNLYIQPLAEALDADDDPADRLVLALVSEEPIVSDVTVPGDRL